MSGREKQTAAKETAGVSGKIKFRIFLIALLLAGVVTGVVTSRMHAAAQEKMTALQEHMAGEVLRFHVLANSDSKEDQELKMKVKEAVLSYMEYKMPKHTDLVQTKQWVSDHIGELGDIAQAVVCGESYDYPVHLELTTSDFPEKTYGDVTFPAGEYEALRIEIGEAKGQNWWCVLFPNLCFIDAVHAVVPEDGKQELKEVLTDEEYDLVTSDAKVKVRWFFFPEKDDK